MLLLGVMMEEKTGPLLLETQLTALEAGEKLTTCEPRAHLEAQSPAFCTDRFEGKGCTFQATDEKGEFRLNIVLTDVFITTYGNPNPAFISRMGYGRDVGLWQKNYAAFWSENFTEKLGSTTELFVTSWKRAD